MRRFGEGLVTLGLGGWNKVIMEIITFLIRV